MQNNKDEIFAFDIEAARIISTSTTIPAAPSSPYSRRYPNRGGLPIVSTDDLVTTSKVEDIFTFETNSLRGGSPYSRRYPATEKRHRLEQYNLDEYHKNNDWTPSISSEPEDFEILSRETTQIQHNVLHEPEDIQFPIEMHRYQSMQSLRHRRDPHYQGIRSRKARRVIDKTGHRNIGFLNIPQRSWRFFKDFSTTLIDEQWRYVITVFALSYFLCWILFGALWYLIAHAHGDLDFNEETGERLSDGPKPCIEGCTTFAGYLLFSIETQVSIGYGSRYPNEQCPEAVFLMVVQIVVGIAIEGAMVGIVYAKMIRPPRKASEMNFSRKAVICQRNSKLCLLFRICDTRHNHMVDTKVQAFWFEDRNSMEGEKLKQFQHSLKLENAGKVFMIFPITVCHVIDSSSPLYDLSAKDLLEKRFELVITLSGSSRSTGQITETRTSYLPKEVMWGNRFVNMISYDRHNAIYVSDFDKFDEIEAYDTPLCSARRLKEVMEEIQRLYDNNLLPPEEYFTENLNYINDSMDEKYDRISMEMGGVGGADDDDSGGSISADHHRFQNTTNEMKKLVAELEIRLSRHSLNVEREETQKRANIDLENKN